VEGLRTGPIDRPALDPLSAVAASADKLWTEAKRHVHNVGREIEEKPIASAFTAFATGIILGLFLAGRRG
jgi:ElaB/YqjD/DUF883 family membrane-anchored ribosome-binding protein